MEAPLNSKIPVYLFSGLGADERAFQRLDLSAWNIQHVKWNLPATNESIESYAARLLPQITNERPVFIGLSFGGVMAIEVAKLISVQCIILLASIKNRSEIPPYFRFAAQIGFDRTIPVYWLKKANSLTNWLFGASSPEDKLLLKQILTDTDPSFLSWALRALGHWKNEAIPTKIIHIHGSNDRILPLKFVKHNIAVQDGSHLMTLNKATEISSLIKACLETQ